MSDNKKLFAMVSLRFLADYNREALVYGALLTFQGKKRNCYPSLKTLSDRIYEQTSGEDHPGVRMKPQQISKLIHKLAAKGWVLVKRTGRSNTYKVFKEPVFLSSVVESESTTGVESESTTVRDEIKKNTQKNTQKNMGQSPGFVEPNPDEMKPQASEFKKIQRTRMPQVRKENPTAPEPWWYLNCEWRHREVEVNGEIVREGYYYRYENYEEYLDAKRRGVGMSKVEINAVRRIC